MNLMIVILKLQAGSCLFKSPNHTGDGDTGQQPKLASTC
jgi:hypothetical protein